MTTQLALTLAVDDGVPASEPPAPAPGTGRHKPKINRTGDPGVSHGYDRCQTPPNALVPLLPFLPPHSVVWECAAGEGYLADELERHSHTVIRSDVLSGQNFFTWSPPGRWDLIVTNPPYSNPTKYLWLRRCYELGRPFALLVPAEMRHNATAHSIFHDFGVLPEEISLDRRINFKMPQVGWRGSSAQFPVVWLCHQLLPQLLVLGHVPPIEELYQKRLV